MTTALRSSWKVLPIAVGLSALLGGFVAFAVGASAVTAFLAFSTLVLLGTPMAIAAGLRLLW
jgi:hypothetical protein